MGYFDHSFYERLQVLLTDEFLKDTTLFSSFEEFIRLLPVMITDDQSLMKGVNDGRLDLFIDDTTDFATWTDFLKAVNLGV
ncbi:hypothetical protein [Halobacillus sp. Marseille-Q1614]|uniref:hypothetical protein n=1 Tax=Halobacillus sp. Marseille-Q1614 TaxID=2709134 RepID=UPI0015702D1F|nr:hypothetical protein [Halobacillus sp. Marseille-Q1614]